jgi:hypothetical protein
MNVNPILANCKKVILLIVPALDRPKPGDNPFPDAPSIKYDK